MQIVSISIVTLPNRHYLFHYTECLKFRSVFMLVKWCCFTLQNGDCWQLPQHTWFVECCCTEDGLFNGSLWEWKCISLFTYREFNATRRSLHKAYNINRQVLFNFIIYCNQISMITQPSIFFILTSLIIFVLYKKTNIRSIVAMWFRCLGNWG